MSESDGAAGVGRAAVKVRTPHKDVGKKGGGGYEKKRIPVGVPIKHIKGVPVPTQTHNRRMYSLAGAEVGKRENDAEKNHPTFVVSFRWNPRPSGSFHHRTRPISHASPAAPRLLGARRLRIGGVEGRGKGAGAEALPEGDQEVAAPSCGTTPGGGGGGGGGGVRGGKGGWGKGGEVGGERGGKGRWGKVSAVWTEFESILSNLLHLGYWCFRVLGCDMYCKRP